MAIPKTDIYQNNLRNSLQIQISVLSLIHQSIRKSKIMTNVYVITTPSMVYCTFYKSIHLSVPYKNQDELDAALTDAQSLAFRLACTTPKPNCESKLFETEMSDGDIFRLLDICA